MPVRHTDRPLAIMFYGLRIPSDSARGTAASAAPAARAYSFTLHGERAGALARRRALRGFGASASAAPVCSDRVRRVLERAAFSSSSSSSVDYRATAAVALPAYLPPPGLAILGCGLGCCLFALGWNFDDVRARGIHAPRAFTGCGVGVGVGCVGVGQGYGRYVPWAQDRRPVSLRRDLKESTEDVRAFFARLFGESGGRRKAGQKQGKQRKNKKKQKQQQQEEGAKTSAVEQQVSPASRQSEQQQEGPVLPAPSGFGAAGKSEGRGAKSGGKRDADDDRRRRRPPPQHCIEVRE